MRHNNRKYFKCDILKQNSRHDAVEKDVGKQNKEEKCKIQ